MFNYFSANIKRKISSHSVMVALPLSIITVFCFSYVIMQPSKTLKKDEGTAASKRPSLFTGKALPEIKSPALTDTDSQKLTTNNQASSLPTTTNNSTSASSPTTSSPQTPQTTNPQQSVNINTGTGNYSKSNKASDLPVIKVNLSQTVTKLLNQL